MPAVVELGSLKDLFTVSNEMKERLKRRGLEGEEQINRICSNMLVDHPAKQALVLPGGTRIAGDLVLDEEAFGDRAIGTVAVLGDLTVEGRILNEEADTGLFLIVDGDVTVAGVAKGGANVVIFGSLRSPGTVFCDSGYGTLVAGGEIAAAAVIASDQEVYAGAGVSGLVVSDELGNMRERLVPEVFQDPADPEDEWPDGDLVRERLASGLAVIKA